MDNNLGHEILNKIHSVLNPKGIKFFIHAGTLLGLWRDKRFIPHDDDIDIGIINYDTDTIKTIETVLIQNGFHLIWEFFYKGELTEQTYFYKDTKIDLFYFKSDDKNSWHYTYYRLNDEKDDEMNVIKNMYNKIDYINQYIFSGHIVNIPSNTEDILKAIYGEGWVTPTKNYIYYKPDNAIKCTKKGLVKWR